MTIWNFEPSVPKEPPPYMEMEIHRIHATKLVRIANPALGLADSKYLVDANFPGIVNAEKFVQFLSDYKKYLKN